MEDYDRQLESGRNNGAQAGAMHNRQYRRIWRGGFCDGRDGEEKMMGWQNQPSCDLEDAAKLMPGVTSTRVALVHQEGE